MTTKTGRDAAVAGLQAYRLDLLTELERIRSDLSVVDRSIELLGGTANKVQTATTTSASARSEAGPQQVVIDFLKQNPGQFFKPTEAAKLIVGQGYRPKHPKVWVTQVATCLKRATIKGVAEKQERDGRIVFALKQDVPGNKV